MGATRLRVGRAIALAIACASCGDDGAPAVLDAGGDPFDGGPGPMPMAPMPPATAILPMMGPCPEGWDEVVIEDDVPTCEPWAPGGAVECAPGEILLPGM